MPADTTLSIAPGTTVTLAAGVALTVEGALIAQGTAEAPITFTGDASSPWRSLVFADGAVDASFEGWDQVSGGSIVENAVIEHAARGMELQGASPYLHAVTFRENEIASTIETIGGAALLVSAGATPRIRDCSFEDNVANIFAYGGAIYVDDADPIVQDDAFTGNTSSYGGAIATDLMASPIVGSTFDGNESLSEGGAISLVSSVSALLNNTITANHTKTEGGGVHVCVDCDPHATPALFDNVITGNLSDGDAADDGSAGVGAAFLAAMQHNDIAGNLRSGSRRISTGTT